MKLTALAYTAFQSELVVELSMSIEGADGEALPFRFMGRIVRPGAGEGLDSPAQMVQGVARVLMQMALDLESKPAG